MELFSDVRLDRVEAQRWRRDAGEREDVFGHYDLGLTQDRIAEGHVDSEGVPVALTGEFALGTEAEPFVLE